MSSQMSPVQSTKDHVADVRSIDPSGIDGRRLQRSKFAGRFAEDGITLSLVHLDVALAVKAEGRDVREAADGVPCFKVSAKRLAHGSGHVEAMSAEKISKTPSFGAYPTHLRQRKLRMIPTRRSVPTPSASPS